MSQEVLEEKNAVTLSHGALRSIYSQSQYPRLVNFHVSPKVQTYHENVHLLVIPSPIQTENLEHLSNPTSIWLNY